MTGATEEHDQGACPKFIRMSSGTHIPITPPRREYMLMTPEERCAEFARLCKPVVTHAAIDFTRRY